MRRSRKRFLTALAVLGLFGAAASGVHQPLENGGGTTPIDLLRQADGREPPQRLGLRSSIFRATQVMVPTVVVVETPRAAAAAISAWQGPVRFPVFIDDGSARAAEDIGRFVRAFEPESVLRWTPDVPELPASRAERQQQIVSVWNRGLRIVDAGPDPMPALRRLREVGLGVNGAVVIDANDDAWVAGLALAVARTQAVLFAESTGGVGSLGSPEMAGRLSESITTQLDRLGLSWRELGDEIDSVTLAMNTFTKVNDAGYRGQKTQTSITDRITRHDAPTGPRWAWAGVVHGSASEAMYRAMCGLFLPVESAWLFDGYVGGQPWDAFDLTAAAGELRRVGVRSTVIDRPDNGAAAWRRATSGGIDADLVMINSKGLVGSFDVSEETLQAGAAPILRRPAIGVMVHSWSASEPARATSVAGRWLEHGAYAWYGSVQEPMLNAFVPSPSVAQRFAAGLPLAAAVAYDDGPGWKLLYLGDPLLTAGKAENLGTRSDEQPTIPGSVPIEDEMRTAAKDRDFAKAIRSLVMLGRDADASRLARGILKDRPEAFTAAVVNAAVLPLFRDGRSIEAIEAAGRLGQGDLLGLTSADAIWHAARTIRPDEFTPEMIETLGANLRRGQIPQDAAELGSIVKVRSGGQEAGRFLSRVADTIEQRGWADRVREVAGEFLDGRR